MPFFCKSQMVCLSVFQLTSPDKLTYHRSRRHIFGVNGVQLTQKLQYLSAAGEISQLAMRLSKNIVIQKIFIDRSFICHKCVNVIIRTLFVGRDVQLFATGNAAEHTEYIRIASLSEKTVTAEPPHKTDLRRVHKAAVSRFKIGADRYIHMQRKALVIARNIGVKGVNTLDYDYLPMLSQKRNRLSS